MNSRVHVETTVPGYRTAWPGRVLVRAAHQQITREWVKRSRFDWYSSRPGVMECQAGEPTAAADRLATLAGIPLREQTPDAAALVEGLVRGVQLLERATADALPIARATVHGMDHLLTWNCTHIANATRRPRTEAVCRGSGYEPPLIRTPEELPTGGQDDDRR